MMKTTLLRRITLTLTTFTTAALFTGCGTTSGYQQADMTGEGIATFREEIVSGKQAINDTLKSLDQVAVSATSDPRQAFEQYSESVASLDAAAVRVRKCSEDVKAQGKAYFEQWEKELAQVKKHDRELLKATRERAKKAPAGGKRPAGKAAGARTGRKASDRGRSR